MPLLPMPRHDLHPWTWENAMKKHTPDRENSTDIKVWIQDDLLAWIDEQADKQERSRAYMINRALRRYQSITEGARRNRARNAA